MSKQLLDKAKEEIHIFERPSVNTSRELIKCVEKLEELREAVLNGDFKSATRIAE